MRSPWKIIGFSCVTMLVGLLLLECTAWIGLSVIKGKMMTYENLPTILQHTSDEIDQSNEDQILREHGRDAREVIHPYVGYVYKPEPVLQFLKHKENDLRNFGFGSGRLINPRDEDNITIGIFGGSVAYFFGYRDGTDELRRELMKAPQFAGKNIHLIPTGTPSFKQPQQLLAYNYLLSLGAEFDIIINLDGFNEVALPLIESINYGTFAHYPRRWAPRLEFENLDPRMRILLSDILRIQEMRKESSKNRPTIMVQGVAVQLIDEFRGWRERSLLKKYVALKDVEHKKTYMATGPIRTYESEDRAYEDFVENWAQSSLTMHREAEGHSTRYIHILQPNQYVAGSKALTDKERLDAWGESKNGEKDRYQIGVEAGYPLLIKKGEELRESGVEFYDFTMIYKDVSDLIYVDTCCHVNRLGNRIMAQKMAEIILSKM